jgi:hypothetical protein
MKPTSNRKTKLGPDIATFNSYRVNSKKSGLYRELLAAIIGQLEICFALHGRLLVVRFDLHSYGFKTVDGNDEVSLFIKRIVQWVRRNYETDKVGRVWVRERERAKHQHYHCALLIDGDKIRHPKKLLAPSKRNGKATARITLCQKSGSLFTSLTKALGWMIQSIASATLPSLEARDAARIR